MGMEGKGHLLVKCFVNINYLITCHLGPTMMREFLESCWLNSSETAIHGFCGVDSRVDRTSRIESPGFSKELSLAPRKSMPLRVG